MIIANKGPGTTNTHFISSNLKKHILGDDMEDASLRKYFLRNYSYVFEVRKKGRQRGCYIEVVFPKIQCLCSIWKMFMSYSCNRLFWDHVNDNQLFNIIYFDENYHCSQAKHVEKMKNRTNLQPRLFIITAVICNTISSLLPLPIDQDHTLRHHGFSIMII